MASALRFAHSAGMAVSLRTRTRALTLLVLPWLASCSADDARDTAAEDAEALDADAALGPRDDTGATDDDVDEATPTEPDVGSGRPDSDDTMEDSTGTVSDGAPRDTTSAADTKTGEDAGEQETGPEPDARATDASAVPDAGPEDAAASDALPSQGDGDPGPVDDIYGVAVPRASAWWVADGRIHRGTQAVRLRGLSWFGLETADRALHGTWFGRTVEDFLAEVRELGFNALRIPVSPDAINPDHASAPWSHAAYESGPARTGREHLERLLVAAGDAGLWVLLDFHSCSSTQRLTGRPDGCAGYATSDWLDDLGKLAAIALPYDHVLGVDLFNEPHALTWTAWKGLAEDAARVVLEAHPRVLVFVEGVGGLSSYGDAYPFHGENLVSAGADPPLVPPSRLVLSPHTYGPGVAWQAYFGVNDFPANMPAIWQGHFGYLVPEHALAVGEFGGHYDDALAQGEVAWNEAFVGYLATLDRGEPVSFFYWALNANSADTGGLYLDDFRTLRLERLGLLAPLLWP